MTMETVRIKIEDVKRGSLLAGLSGRVVADTLSADERGPFWHDNVYGRHYATDTDGTIAVYVSPVRTDAFGETRGRNGASHALVAGTEIPVCPNGARSGSLTVWESGTALATVTCRQCRTMLRLAPTARRMSSGI